MPTIHLEPAQVPATLRGIYTGRKFQAVVTESVEIPATAGIWDGGSRDVYTAVEIETGRAIAFADLMPSDPWQRDARTKQVAPLRPGVVVVMACCFMGKDHGLTFYVHPDNAAKLLPPPVDDLSATDLAVLGIIRSYIPAARRKHADYEGIGAADYDAALERLKGRGFLNKAGAMTTAGKNAVAAR